MERYTVTPDADRLMPKWLAERVNHGSVRLHYYIRDGTVRLSGIKTGNGKAYIGDTVILDGSRLRIERRKNHGEGEGKSDPAV